MGKKSGSGGKKERVEDTFVSTWGISWMDAEADGFQLGNYILAHYTDTGISDQQFILLLVFMGRERQTEGWIPYRDIPGIARMLHRDVKCVQMDLDNLVALGLLSDNGRAYDATVFENTCLHYYQREMEEKLSSASEEVER